MSRKYRQMTYTDCLKMETLLNAGHSRYEVAKILHFSNSTVYREYNRGRYTAHNSQLEEVERYSSDISREKRRYAATNKGKSVKIGSDFTLVEFLEDKIINEHYSPEAAVALANQSGQFETNISARTLYRYIDMGIFLNLTNSYLPVKGKRRRHKRTVHTAKRASAGESIENRPSDIDSREQFGHWEMDTVRGRQGITKSCLLVLTERKTRKEIIRQLPDGKTSSVVAELNRIEASCGSHFSNIFKTITVDNGVEFSDVSGLEYGNATDKAAKKTEKEEKSKKRVHLYYCHPYSSYERGSNENQNRMIRRLIPKGSDIDDYTPEQIERVESWLNTYPRRMFSFETSSQRFQRELRRVLRGENDIKI